MMLEQVYTPPWLRGSVDVQSRLAACVLLLLLLSTTCLENPRQLQQAVGCQYHHVIHQNKTAGRFGGMGTPSDSSMQAPRVPSQPIPQQQENKVQEDHKAVPPAVGMVGWGGWEGVRGKITMRVWEPWGGRNVPACLRTPTVVLLLLGAGMDTIQKVTVVTEAPLMDDGVHLL
jgi:hypothetical protein